MNHGGETMRPTLTKALPAQVKAAADDAATATGEFTALVSAFGNVDTYGDVVMPGAFTNSLAEWAERGDPIPVVFSHRWDDPDAYMGEVTKAEQTDDGLLVTARVDLDHAPTSQVYRQMKGRRITQFSFAFDIRDGGAGWATRTDAKGNEFEVFELRDLDLIEVGPCLRGVNTATQLESVKAARAAFAPPRAKSSEQVDGAGTTNPQDASGHDGAGAANAEGEENEAPPQGSEPTASASPDDVTASVDLLAAEIAIAENERMTP